ncbi:taste receptor type 2 member 1-like [Hyla sarda]|uniref:taste receptor type 2 member 1-like n=1 Tax=Hyla sarda TaxID=327740 RepID=UPI0024C41B45|nr:taste receptor type 2 member 1-like [Hyla sarda]
MDYRDILFFLILFLIFLGFFLNLFIVITNFAWYLKGEALQSVDIIMTCLSSIRIILLIRYLLGYLVNSPLTTIVVDLDTYRYLNLALMFLVFCSLWWGTALGVFYCVKITTYRNHLFMRLKMNISTTVPWILTGSMVISFISSLPCLWGTHPTNFTSIDSGNISNNEYSHSDHISYIQKQQLNLLIITFAGSILPLLLFCVSIYLLIVSVLKHTRNMNSNNSGFAKPQLEAHKKALITMVSFLLLYFLYFLSSNLLFLSFYTRNPIFRSLCSIGVYSYPSLHSLMLIISNAKLKRSILSAFQSDVFSNRIS